MTDPQVNRANAAEEASQRAIAAIHQSLEDGKSFVLEAGAGAGKTYTLVKSLRFLLARKKKTLLQRHQKIGCITFTNVAKDEIEERIDRDPLIQCDTIHGFCWSLISGFQKQMRQILPNQPAWQQILRADEIEIGPHHTIEYAFGFRQIKEDAVSIHHDDVLTLTAQLMSKSKFRHIVAAKYPFIFIDEYQDTDKGFIEAIESHFLGQPISPLFGFFGDHWQHIYRGGCGAILHPELRRIDKAANFRSVSTIVNSLNRMRPELQQFVPDPSKKGIVRVYHTNSWTGQRQTGSHWAGDLPTDAAHQALATVQEQLKSEGWDLSPVSTKILMLTHRVLADEQGYASLPTVFRYNDAFIRKEDPHIAFFVDKLEPACIAFLAGKYGAMFGALGGRIPAIRNHTEKVRWSASMQDLIGLRNSGTIGQVIDHLRKTKRPHLPDSIEHRERELERIAVGEAVPRQLEELRALRMVAYNEIIALSKYLAGHSPFETKHGVKGAEFENVIIVVGRGWNQYNFNEMLELAQNVEGLPPEKKRSFERNRNLFYVACSRPIRRLVLLFTQELSDGAMTTLHDWFGQESVQALQI